MTVSHFWLLPKLAQFRSEHPGISIRVVSEETLLSPADGIVDMASAFGAGLWSDGEVRPLMKSRILVMAAESLIAAHGPVATPADIMRLPLIAYDALDESWSNWQDWAAAASIQSVPEPTLSFNRYWDALRAAATGQGALLVWSGLTGGIEESGVIAPLPGPALAPKGDFYLVTKADDRSPRSSRCKTGSSRSAA